MLVGYGPPYAPCAIRNPAYSTHLSNLHLHKRILKQRRRITTTAHNVYYISYAILHHHAGSTLCTAEGPCPCDVTDPLLPASKNKTYFD